MRWTLGNYNLFILLILLFCVTQVNALRISRPTEFQLPWTDEQVNDLNDTLEEVQNMQAGRFELDIVTTTKTNAKNGEIWIFNDSGTYKLEFKANDVVNTITP